MFSRRGRRELRCLICSYPKHLCVLCALARDIVFFSLAEAQRPQRTSMFDLFLPKKPLRTLRLGEKYHFFLSQRRQERQELRCIFCAYLKYLCVSARLYFFSSRGGAEAAENTYRYEGQGKTKTIFTLAFLGEN